jgi:hypothetical protein
MKANKVVALAMFATVTLAIAGTVCAGSGKGAMRASSGRSASSGAGRANMSQALFRASNRRFSRSNFSYYPYYGYGYGNAIVQNPDEADWAEQWRSLREENDGPYARSTWENPQGAARMWEFPEDGSTTNPSH